MGKHKPKKVALLEICAETNKVIKCEFRNIKVEPVNDGSGGIRNVR